MNRDRVIQIVAACVLLLSLGASAVLSMQLSNSAGRNKLAYTVSQEAGDPPQVAIGIAMGAFRGLFVNFLWVRANTLKEEGKYHEAMDLAKAITTLQPRFPDVWVFHAWNMAYNISVTTHTLDERWAWVNRGIDLLRQKGVVYNPTDLAIHKELGWIFLHKISGYMDDANPDYKRRLALEWTLVLGDPPPFRARESREDAIARYVEWLTPIDEAPGSLDTLIDQDPAVAALVNAYTETVSPVIDRDFLGRYARHMALRRSGRREFLLARFRNANTFGPRAEAMEKLLDNPDFDDAWAPLLAHVRKRVLIDEYNMQPGQMIRFTQKYGPLDWRHAASHAVYWVARGVEGALTRRSLHNERDYDFVNTDRITIQAVQDLFRSGQIYFDFVGIVANPTDAKAVYIGFNNPHFVKTYQIILDELRARAGVYERTNATNETPGRIYTIYSAGYENFMKDVIRYYYRMGMKDKATQLKDELGQWEGMNTNNPDRAAHYAQDIETFVRLELRERLETPQVVATEVQGALIAAYIYGLLLDDQELFDDNMAYAKLVHRNYFDKQAVVNPMAPDMSRMESQLDVDFEIVEAWAFVSTMAMLNPSDAEHLYDRADNHLRVISYDAIADIYRAAYDESGEERRSFDEVFPEPPGLEAQRIRAARIAQERAARALNQEQK
jgi:hypothetical protein